MMKRIYIIILLLYCWVSFLPAQDICSPVREGYLSMSDEKKKLTVLLSGASFASVDNGWFELGCEALRAKGINRAIGGEAIADVANRMSRGDLYSREELDEVDVFVIMQVHNRDVYAPNELKKDYHEYALPFTRGNYAAAFDYVIKKYISDCYQLQFDKGSKYYGVKGGKPAVILLCTVEHPETHRQTSTLFADDTECIDGVEYGWHPNRGKDCYIQNRMAAVFVAQIQSLVL